MSERRQLMATDLLSPVVSFPNARAATRLAQLVGLDDHIETLTRDFRLIFDPQLVETWSQRLYGARLPIIHTVQETVPLVVFQGDVGTGKTALAETIGQRIAEDGGFGVHLVKLSTQVRGTGYVGEMGTLLGDSFKEVERIWERKSEPILLIIDEADSLLTTRDADWQHHEDKSGVNTILQHLDSYRESQAQVAVIAITNRGSVIDPAVRRRATAILLFERPNIDQCRTLLQRLFGPAFSDKEFALLMEAVNEKLCAPSHTPYTFSDLTLRFAVPAVREAVWNERKLNAKHLAASLRQLVPTGAMSDGASR